MKRVLLSIFLLALLPALAYAEHVETARAQKAAKTFFNNNGLNATKLTDLTAEAGFTNLYIYNADKGFVVMASDDCVQPIFSWNGELTTLQPGYGYVYHSNATTDKTLSLP